MDGGETLEWEEAELRARLSYEPSPAAVEPTRRMWELADELPIEEATDWCTEWLLANAKPEALADFIICAMRHHEDLELLVEERSMGDEE